MGLSVTSMESASAVSGARIFVSASIPDPDRWDGDYDPLAITDAVVALSRAFLTHGIQLVSAAHPTIAPLLLYVAAEFPRSRERRVVIYQSQLFQDVLPTATRRFEQQGVGKLVWTAAAEGDAPRPGSWNRSLSRMRQQMLNETRPAAAVFIGGMQGIPEEFELFGQLFPGRPRYPLGSPGGEARALVNRVDSPIAQRLQHEETYPALARLILEDLERYL